MLRPAIKSVVRKVANLSHKQKQAEQTVIIVFREKYTNDNKNTIFTFVPLVFVCARDSRPFAQQIGIRACEWEIGCIWGFGFVSVLSLFCILPF
jgi:hypothetical protein